MTPTSSQDDDVDPILVEAADWLVRLTSGEATAEDAQALEAWRAQSPTHERAFRELSGMRAVTRALRKDTQAHRRRDVLLGAVGLAAAGTGGYGIARPPFGLWPSLAELTADHRTVTGQRLAFSPTAGVDVEMNSRTSLSLLHGGAGVSLVQGEVFVAVTKPGQPLVVQADDGRIGAVQSARFNVQWLDGVLHVACVDGALSCMRAGRRTGLRTGEALAVGRDGRMTRTAADPAVATAWLQGLLIFNGTPLADAIAQINLYRPGRIILTNAAIGRRPVVGIFHTSQIENAVGEIQQLLDLSLRRLPGGVVLIG